MSDQSQRTGNNSTNIQAGNLTINQGLSLEEVRQIALDVSRVQLNELTGIAREIARQRIDEITGAFLEKLEARYPLGLQQAQEPDFQFALSMVQREHARFGDKELGDLLVDLLVDRTRNDTRSVLQIVLDESLTVAAKLTADQLASLTLIFILGYTINRRVLHLGALWTYLDQFILPFAGDASDKKTCYQHLEYCGCGTVGLGVRDLPKILQKSYGGIFSRGFDQAQFDDKKLSIPLSHPLIRPCLRDPSLWQVDRINEEEIKSAMSALTLPEEDTTSLIALHNEHLMTPAEVKDVIVGERPYMAEVFRKWSESDMSHLSLTSVGIAIGHANAKRSLGEFTDLSIWIN